MSIIHHVVPNNARIQILPLLTALEGEKDTTKRKL